MVEFFTLMKPANTKGRVIEAYLEKANQIGVLALRNEFKRRYKVNLEDADASESGWNRVYRKLEEFYKVHTPDRDIKLVRIFSYAKEKGLLALDEQLKTKYGESLSEFSRRGLDSWKREWQPVLTSSHAESVTYELKRFYNFVETLPRKYPKKQNLDVLVEWATKHSRIEVNEKLIEKYNFSLDDVKMIPGNTTEERKINLKGQLIEFYQKHDPAKLGNQSQKEGVETPEMAQINRDAEIGIIKLEQLEEKLKRMYGEGLTTNFKRELKERLRQFYLDLGKQKTSEALDKLVEVGEKQGLEELNKKLHHIYGKVVPIDDL